MDQAYLKERLSYDPATGVFTWNRYENRTNAWNARFAGKEAGNVYCRKDGYRTAQIGIDYKLYLTARLVWLYVTGGWPSKDLDHIDHDSTNNRFANLREVTDAENMQNKPKYRCNKSGTTGVFWHERDQRWLAYIRAGGKKIHGGYFKDIADAIARRKELEIQYGYHANHGV